MFRRISVVTEKRMKEEFIRRKSLSLEWKGSIQPLFSRIMIIIIVQFVDSWLQE